MVAVMMCDTVRLEPKFELASAFMVELRVLSVLAAGRMMLMFDCWLRDWMGNEEKIRCMIVHSADADSMSLERLVIFSKVMLIGGDCGVRLRRKGEEAKLAAISVETSVKSSI